MHLDLWGALCFIAPPVSPHMAQQITILLLEYSSRQRLPIWGAGPLRPADHRLYVPIIYFRLKAENIEYIINKNILTFIFI